ncbi:hypothetical protein ES703_44851 [subsurface metagenome]
MSEEKEILTDAEIETLIMQLGEGQKEFSEEQVDIVVRWAKRVSIEYALLQKVLKEELKITVNENSEVMFEKA